MQHPQKNIPRGIFIGILIIVVLYLAVSFSYFKVIGFDALKIKDPSGRGIAAIVAEKMFGSSGLYVSSILLFIAVYQQPIPLFLIH